MNRKLVIASLLAVAAVMVLGVASVAAFALTVDWAEPVISSEKVELLPAKAEPVSQPEVSPARYEHSKSGGCNWQAKQEMTYKKVDQPQVTEASAHMAANQLVNQAQQ
jgi:predicted lysophospholipase L1 biosynthesis ABC-type transport system permease subunit